MTTYAKDLMGLGMSSFLANYLAPLPGGGGGGTPGGSSGQLQFNNSGVFGGTSGLTWDAVNSVLDVAGAINLAASSSATAGTITQTIAGWGSSPFKLGAPPAQ